MNFQESVLNLVKQIPKGKITTYGEIAKALGNIRAARAIGNVLNRNSKLIKIPCHRVVCSNGSVGGYKLGTKRKIELLRGEGIKIEKGKIIDFEKILFKKFRPINIKNLKSKK